ncbi:TetR/AcrR family transcriptional regulator [Variovorax sp. J22P168]|uniref:TetR/AcrR family transcriptional regulator n=1 Tax=Variovorax jilinensis TaxID=3053513 RepID=UPI002578C303|nr:TetR/AcrR family transcriptional regulator [Variovorax sp. J22P168]MDM0010928.1 TetR/AcrR family transcriptional regulator [Variovorax sp. J22P168]
MGITSATPHKPADHGAVPRRRIDLPQGTGRQRAATAGTDLQRERILQAAAQLFAAQGYANTTMAQIVNALDVTKPFVYYYFRDKQEIFETLSWRPAVDCFTALDFAATDSRRAVDKVKEGISRLIAATVAHHPCAFFAYKEPQVYRPEYLAAQKRLAHHFYDQLFPLLEQARRDGDLDFGDTRITAFAALSLPGFLYSWYRPDGRLPPEDVVAELSRLAWRVLGLRERAR